MAFQAMESHGSDYSENLGQDGGENHGQDARATESFLLSVPAISKRKGAYLPHWTRDGAIYSVTFRLADSLPKSVVQKWADERDAIVHAAEKLKRPLVPEEAKRLQYLFSEKVEAYLDRGQGACWMKQAGIAQIVAGALGHFDGERYRLHAWCVMPNHVHTVVEPFGGHELSKILHAWKSFSANQANKALRRNGVFWQPESFDHLVRDEQDYAHCVEYVLQNPHKAGMKDWKWVGGGRQSGGMGFESMNAKETSHGQDDSGNHG